MGKQWVWCLIVNLDRWLQVCWQLDGIGTNRRSMTRKDHILTHEDPRALGACGGYRDFTKSRKKRSHWFNHKNKNIEFLMVENDTIRILGPKDPRKYVLKLLNAKLLLRLCIWSLGPSYKIRIWEALNDISSVPVRAVRKAQQPKEKRQREVLPYQAYSIGSILFQTHSHYASIGIH